MSGRVAHFEIPAEDMARASSFYSDAFGWQLQSMPGMGYTLMNTTPADDQGIPTRGRVAVGDMGFAGYFKDPEGNVLGLWENATP
ncbi:MAG: VOC family protein [Actinomycetota bacterium]|nr:VOC family protein [Actinomycetota bacterium]